MPNNNPQRLTTTDTSFAGADIIAIDAFRRSTARMDASPPPIWQIEAVRRVVAFQEHRQGWDGYNGKPLRHDAGLFALRVLTDVMTSSTPVPAIVPTADGGIQLEWHQDGFDIEVNVSAPYNVSMWHYDHRAALETAVDLSRGDFSALKQRLSVLNPIQGAPQASHA